MKDTLKALGYPQKIYLYLVIFVATVIGMKYVLEVNVPGGQRPPYLFLVWNTFLAWIPMGLAVILDAVILVRSKWLKLLLLLVMGPIWLFFYPNAAYMITDLLHPFGKLTIEGYRFWHEMPFWNHLFPVLFVALLGLVLGCLSLASVHRLVTLSLGKMVGWVFAVTVLALSSFGIYLGRFIRWNSWDILQEPLYVLKETALYFTDAGNLLHAAAFCKWIFLITLFSYVVMEMFGGIRRGSADLLHK